MILVTGAAGNYGSNAIDHLLRKGVTPSDITGLVRSEEKGESLNAKGIKTKRGDYADIDLMTKVFEGVDQLLLVSSSDRGAVENRTKHHINAIKAAKEAGVKHIVYTSFVRTPGHEGSAIADFQNAHVASERFLKESGITYTILQNGIYLEMILAFAGEKVAETGTILFPARKGAASWVLREELAEAAAHILTTKDHENKTYTLTNTESVGFEEIAKDISTALGKEITYQSPSIDEFESILKKAGVPDIYIGMFVMWGTAVAQGMMDLNDLTQTSLTSFLGRKPTTVKEFIHLVFGSA